jgi:hypothetical protein
VVRQAVIEIQGEPAGPEAGATVVPDKYYNPGSHISLSCIIRRKLIRNATVQEITNVTWKKGGLPLDLHSEERVSMGVQVEGDTIHYTLYTMHYSIHYTLYTINCAL